MAAFTIWVILNLAAMRGDRPLRFGAYRRCGWCNRDIGYTLSKDIGYTFDAMFGFFVAVKL